jgi:hypothetical protein
MTKQSRISFIISFGFAKSKALATVFLDQAKKKQRTCHTVVSSLLGYPRIFNFARALRDSVVAKQQLQTVLTLYPRKIKNISATQMRGFKECILCHCCDTSCLAMTEEENSFLVL